MMNRRRMRWILSVLALMTAAGLVLAACAPRPAIEDELTTPAEEQAPEDQEADTTEEEETAQPATADTEYNEAPMLAEMVAAGDLPNVDERLPENPLVVEAVDSIGEYGGTWRRVFLGINDFHAFGRLNYDPILRWPRDPNDGIQPGLAESWEWSEDGTELTLNLREGLKWSDGEPFTTADITFWWEDIENDTEITESPHTEWLVDGEPMELEVVDDNTIILHFAGPNGLAETVGLAFHGNQWPLGFERFGFFAPRHYLEQYHPRYNEEATYEDFEDMAFDFNTERPSMTPWVISEWSAGATEMEATRNPYYWKVDAEGNQLPYIDSLYFSLVQDSEAASLLALAGDIDMQSRHMDFAKYTVFQEQAEDGGYHTGLWTTANSSHITFYPNQSYPDEQYRELLQNVDFRRALSMAIDRDLINDVSYLGQGVPYTQPVVRNSALYQDDIDTTYVQYDPDAAAALLDEIGLQVNDEGMRTFEDGTPINLIVETHFTSGAPLDGVELAAEAWREIGLQTTVQTRSREVYWPRAGANEVMIAVWGTDRGLVPMVDPIYLFPFDERSWMAPAFGTWYNTGGEQGEEPTEAFQEAMELYDEYRSTTDADAQHEIARDLVRRAAENMWIIGTVGESPAVAVIKDNFHNVIENDFVADWIIMAPGTQDPSHYYFSQE